jgi:hypothetical protein
MSMVSRELLAEPWKLPPTERGRHVRGLVKGTGEAEEGGLAPASHMEANTSPEGGP